MAFDTRPNLSSEKFEQFSGETLNLSGITRSYGAFEYGIDNSANYHDRSIPDVGWVLSLFDSVTGSSVGAGNGLTLNNGNIILGGTLTGDTIIDNDNYTLDFLGKTSINFKNSLNNSRHDFLMTTLGATDVSLLSFRNNTGRTITDGYSDIWIGTNNGNSGGTSGGNIGLGSNNLTSISPSGTFYGDPWWQTFQGDRNIAIGFRNGKSLTGGAGNAASGNILFGTRVMEAATQLSYNIFMGFQTAMNFSVPLSGVNGQSNIGIGNYTMSNVVSGKSSNNAFLGGSIAGNTISLGDSNTAIGNYIFQNVNTIGDSNIGIGNSVFRNSGTLKDHNTAIGSHAFRETDTDIWQSTAVGTEAGVFAGGFSNTYLGAFSGFIVRGQYNTSIGASSGWVDGNNIVSDTTGPAFTGNRSVFIGYQSGYNTGTTNLNDVIVIGSQFRPVLESGSTYIGGLNKIKLVINNTDDVLTLDDQNLTLTKQAKYSGDFSSGFTKHSIVDVNYVTGITSTLSGGSSSVANGLSKNGDTIVLGGLLTGDTVISGASTHSLVFGDLNSESYLNIFEVNSDTTTIWGENGVNIYGDGTGGVFVGSLDSQTVFDASDGAGNNISKITATPTTMKIEVDDVVGSSDATIDMDGQTINLNVFQGGEAINQILIDSDSIDITQTTGVNGINLHTVGNLTINADGVIVETTGSGMTYLEDYSSGFTKHSIVDVNYVTGITSQISTTLVVTSMNIADSVILDLSTADVFLLTLTGNVTSFNYTGETIGKQYIFKIIKETTEKTFTWASGRYRFPFGNAPVLTNPTTNGSDPAYSEDIITAICMSSGRLDVVTTPNMQSN